MYDSLNVFLACNIFTKERKKVTLNMDFYEYLPDQFKELIDERDIPASAKNSSNSDSSAEKKRKMTTRSDKSHDSKKSKKDAEVDIATAKFLVDDKKLKQDVGEVNARIKDKVGQLTEMVEQQVRVKRLCKRNRKIERSIRKRLLPQGMDVSFENQRCQIPFILVKMAKHPDFEPVEHDGASLIKLHSSTEIDCLGDAQVISQIYPQKLDTDPVAQPTADFSRDFQRMRHYLPHEEYTQFSRVLKKANRKYHEVEKRISDIAE